MFKSTLLTRGFVGSSPQVSCVHECATVRLCDELSQSNMVSEPKVVPGMIWLTCEGECWKYFICEIRSHIDKIVDC